jgi:transposase-like protein
MKRTRHTAEQIIRKLKTAEQLIAQGKTVIEVCRVIEVTQPTYHRWRQQYGGMQAEEARRLTQLEKENARLKKLLAEAELEKAMLKDLAEGNFWARNAGAGLSVPCRSVTGLLNARSAGWWASTAARSAMAARSSRSRMASSGIAYGRSRLSTSAGAAAWPTACCGGRAGP